MLVLSTHISDKRGTDALKRVLEDIDAPGWAVIFGDRKEMMEAALDLHYKGIKLVHVGGGDAQRGIFVHEHPDHRTRDAISMLCRVHCVANERAWGVLQRMGIGIYDDGLVVVTGSPGLDEVVRYADTLDPRRQRAGVFEWFPETPARFEPRNSVHPFSRDEFLHKLAHCALFRSNSSAALYEAPIFNTPVELVGDRQRGRISGPFHHPEGRACEEIAKIIRQVCL